MNRLFAACFMAVLTQGKGYQSSSDQCSSIFIYDDKYDRCIPIPGWETEPMYKEYYSNKPTCKMMPPEGYTIVSMCNVVPIRGRELDPMYDEYYAKRGGRPANMYECNIRCHYPDWVKHPSRCVCIPAPGREQEPMYDQFWQEMKELAIEENPDRQLRALPDREADDSQQDCDIICLAIYSIDLENCECVPIPGLEHLPQYDDYWKRKGKTVQKVESKDLDWQIALKEYYTRV